MYYQLLSIFLNALSVLLAKVSFSRVSENAFLIIYSLTFIALALMHVRLSEMVRYLCSRNGMASVIFKYARYLVFLQGA